MSSVRFGSAAAAIAMSGWRSGTEMAAQASVTQGGSLPGRALATSGLSLVAAADGSAEQVSVNSVVDLSYALQRDLANLIGADAIIERLSADLSALPTAKDKISYIRIGAFSELLPLIKNVDSSRLPEFVRVYNWLFLRAYELMDFYSPITGGPRDRGDLFNTLKYGWDGFSSLERRILLERPDEYTQDVAGMAADMLYIFAEKGIGYYDRVGHMLMALTEAVRRYEAIGAAEGAQRARALISNVARRNGIAGDVIEFGRETQCKDLDALRDMLKTYGSVGFSSTGVYNGLYSWIPYSLRMYAELFERFKYRDVAAGLRREADEAEAIGQRIGGIR